MASQKISPVLKKIVLMRAQAESAPKHEAMGAALLGVARSYNFDRGTYALDRNLPADHARSKVNAQARINARAAMAPFMSGEALRQMQPVGAAVTFASTIAGMNRISPDLALCCVEGFLDAALTVQRAADTAAREKRQATKTAAGAAMAGPKPGQSGRRTAPSPEKKNFAALVVGALGLLVSVVEDAEFLRNVGDRIRSPLPGAAGLAQLLDSAAAHADLIRRRPDDDPVVALPNHDRESIRAVLTLKQPLTPLPASGGAKKRLGPRRAHPSAKKPGA